MRGFTILMTLGLVSVAAAAQAPAPPARATAAAKPAVKPAGSLAQVMRGIYFSNSNVIFDVQQNDPGAPKKKSEGGASATDTYNDLTDACSGCHEAYRDTGPADSPARCTAPPK
jgi:cytochrome c556